MSLIFVFEAGSQPTKSHEQTGLSYFDQVDQVSISPTFYEQLLHQNPFAKKLQTQIVST